VPTPHDTELELSSFCYRVRGRVLSLAVITFFDPDLRWYTLCDLPPMTTVQLQLAVGNRLVG
jgi:hypothetical protein